MSLELRSLLPYPNSCRGTSPHQQERDTKMAMLSFGGIDVAKDRLDVVVLPEEECSSVPNDAAGCAAARPVQPNRRHRSAPKSIPPRARLRRPTDPSPHRYLRKRALPSSYSDRKSVV